MVVAAILGGGSGARMGASVPKQFLPLGDAPVLVHSVRTAVKSGLADAVLALVPEAYIGFTRDALRAAGLGNGVAVLPGGQSRGETLLRALEYTEAAFGPADDTVLLTHDAARPFLTVRMMEENIRGALEYGAANTCVPATDTVFLSEDGRFISAVPPRKNVYHAQSPQTFRAALLRELIGSMPAEEFLSLTDGCSVFTRCGRPVYMARGSETNIKITYPADLGRARQILASFDPAGGNSD